MSNMKMKPDAHLAGGGFANRTAQLPAAKGPPSAGPQSVKVNHPSGVTKAVSSVYKGNRTSLC